MHGTIQWRRQDADGGGGAKVRPSGPPARFKGGKLKNTT